MLDSDQSHNYDKYWDLNTYYNANVEIFILKPSYIFYISVV